MGLSKPEYLEGWIKEKGTIKTIKSSSDDMMPSLMIDEKKWLQYDQKNRLKNCIQFIVVTSLVDTRNFNGYHSY